MGVLIYGPSAVEFVIEDRPLEHLRLVILNRFRRNEAVALHLPSPASGGAREVVWLHPAIPLRFRFDDDRPPQVNRAWAEVMLAASYSGGSLRLLREPGLDAVRGGIAARREPDDVLAGAALVESDIGGVVMAPPRR